MYISVKDRLLTFGDGRHGKLGQDQESYCNLYVPTLIERFNNFHIDQVRQLNRLGQSKGYKIVASPLSKQH